MVPASQTTTDTMPRLLQPHPITSHRDLWLAVCWEGWSENMTEHALLPMRLTHTTCQETLAPNRMNQQKERLSTC